MPDDRLKLAAYCPLCGARPVQVETRVLGGKNDAQLLHVTCRRCAAQMLTLTLVTASSSGAVGLITDLSAEDAVRFVRLPAISADQVLEIHQWLVSPTFSWEVLPEISPVSSPKSRRPVRHVPKRAKDAKSLRPRRSI